MELKDFIANSIKQIADGIIEGNKYIQEKVRGSEGVSSHYKNVTFDVAVTTNEEEKDNLGGKIAVVQIFSASASTESTNKTSNYSRIQFTIALHVKTD